MSVWDVVFHFFLCCETFDNVEQNVYLKANCSILIIFSHSDHSSDCSFNFYALFMYYSWLNHIALFSCWGWVVKRWILTQTEKNFVTFILLREMILFVYKSKMSQDTLLSLISGR